MGTLLHRWRPCRRLPPTADDGRKQHTQRPETSSNRCLTTEGNRVRRCIRRGTRFAANSAKERGSPTKESPMANTNEQTLQIILDVHQYRLTPDEEATLRGDCEALARQVENFPHADLHVLIEGN